MISGRVWKYKDNVNTDMIYPGKYLYTINDPKEMADHSLENFDTVFSKNVKSNDIIVAGNNWGCGSSREQAVLCLKASGVGAIIAKSFARIYYRNCLNLGLPALTCPEAVDVIRNEEKIALNMEAGEIHYQSQVFQFPPLPETLNDILSAGGLVAYVRRELTSGK